MHDRNSGGENWKWECELQYVVCGGFVRTKESARMWEDRAVVFKKWFFESSRNTDLLLDKQQQVRSVHKKNGLFYVEKTPTLVPEACMCESVRLYLKPVCESMTSWIPRCSIFVTMLSRVFVALPCWALRACSLLWKAVWLSKLPPALQEQDLNKRANP